MPNLLALALALAQIGVSAFQEIDSYGAAVLEIEVGRIGAKWMAYSHIAYLTRLFTHAGAVAGSLAVANETADDWPWQEANNRLRAERRQYVERLRKSADRDAITEQIIETFQADSLRRRVQSVTPLGTVAGALAVTELSTRR